MEKKNWRFFYLLLFDLDDLHAIDGGLGGVREFTLMAGSGKFHKDLTFFHQQVRIQLSSFQTALDLQLFLGHSVLPALHELLEGGRSFKEL